MKLIKEAQQNRVESEVLALTAIVRPILQGTLYSLKHEAVQDVGGYENILLRQLPRIYRQGSGDCGICFEYAVHDAILQNDLRVIERVDDALKKCRILKGEPKSILFGAEKAGAIQLISTASELLTHNSRLLSGNKGQPVKFRKHLQGIQSALRNRDVRKQLPWSIGGLWRADLFVGKPEPDQWVGVSVKINKDLLEPAKGLRIGIVPCKEGRKDNVVKDERKNLIVCPIPHDADFMETFYQAWVIVQQFLTADAYIPKEVSLPRPADRQVCRYLRNGGHSKFLM